MKRSQSNFKGMSIILRHKKPSRDGGFIIRKAFILFLCFFVIFAGIVFAAPGNECAPDMVYDCAGNCVDQATARSWRGDGYCDNGRGGIDLTCPEFNNDSNDCDEDFNPAEEIPPLEYLHTHRDPGAWETFGEWNFVEQEGYSVLGGQEWGEAWLASELTSFYNFHFAAKITDDGVALIILRSPEMNNVEAGTYTLTLREGGAVLERRGPSEFPEIVAESQVSLMSNQWYDIEIYDYNGSIRVYVNGTKEIDYKERGDSEEDWVPPTGALGFAGQGVYFDVLQEATALYNELKQVPPDIDMIGFSTFMMHNGKKYILEYEVQDRDAVLANSIELINEGLQVPDIYKVLKRRLENVKYCPPPSILSIHPQNVPLYRGNDLKRGKITIYGYNFVCPGKLGEQEVEVHISNGEISFSEKRYVSPALGPDGKSTDQYKIEIDLLQHLSSLNGQYGWFKVIVENLSTKMKSKPGKIYILPTWHTEEMIVSKIIGFNIEEDGEDGLFDGAPEQFFRFDCGAMTKNLIGSFSPKRLSMNFPNMGYDIFDKKPGQPQEYGVQISVWHSSKVFTSTGLIHYFSGLEEDDDTLEDIFNPLSQIGGGVIGGIIGGLPGIKTGAEIGKELAGTVLPLI